MRHTHDLRQHLHRQLPRDDVNRIKLTHIQSGVEQIVDDLTNLTFKTCHRRARKGLCDQSPKRSVHRRIGFLKCLARFIFFFGLVFHADTGS